MKKELPKDCTDALLFHLLSQLLMPLEDDFVQILERIREFSSVLKLNDHAIITQTNEKKLTPLTVKNVIKHAIKLNCMNE